jgi:transcriptional regulator with XRE-family HTH domain
MYIQKFAAMLSVARTRLGKKQKEIAAEMGFSCTSITAWESQIRLPGADKIPAISRCYKIEESILLEAFRLANEEKSGIGSRGNVRGENGKPKAGQVCFPGEIGNAHVSGILNKKLSFYDK